MTAKRLTTGRERKIVMAGIHETAVIGTGCTIPSSATVGEGCILGEGVVLHENVVLYPGTRIGNYTEIFDNTVIGRPPRSAGNLVHKLKDSFQPVEIGSGCVIGCDVVMYAECVLGDHVLIGDGAKIRENAILEDYALVAMNCTLNHHVTVKKRSKVMDLSHITARTIIEEEVFVAPLVSSANDNNMRLKGKEVGDAQIIRLESGARIGSGSILLPGVQVGADAIVGAGAVVTRDVSAGTRVMGMPAKEK